MSKHSTDERVVQMRFDNSNFEQNVSKTLATLDKLKASLNFSGSEKSFQSVERASRNINFSELSASVDSLSGRFSTFGIVGMTVIQRLTNAAINLGEKLASVVAAPLRQIETGGWNRALNIEKAMFTMRGLVEDFEQQQERIDETINYAVKDTAYSYDAAANAMAQLVASQVEFREGSEDMKNALRAISGVAAVTNSSYEDISQIFTTIAGNGKVMTDQLNRFSYRGLNAAAALGKALGKSEQDIREMVHDGKIDFQTFANAMDNAFGDHAKKANETFTGALANIKAALSRTGQGFATSLQVYGRNILNSIRPNINAFNKAITPLAEGFDKVMSKIADSFAKVFGDGQTAKLNLLWVPDTIATIENMFLGLCGIMDEVRKAFSDLFPESAISTVSSFFEKTRAYSETFRDVFSTIKREVFGVTEETDELKESEEDAEQSAEELLEMATKVIRGDYGNGNKRREELEALGLSYEKIQNKVNELLGCSFRYEVAEEEVAKADEKVADAEEKIADSKWHMLVSDKQREKTLGRLRSILSGISATIKLVGSAAKAAYDIIIRPGISLFLNTIFDILAWIGDRIVSISEKAESFDTFEEICKLIADVLGDVREKIIEVYTWLKNLDSVQRIVKDLKELWERFEDAVLNAADNVKLFSDRVSNLPGVKRLKDAVDRLVDLLQLQLSKALEFIADELDGILSSDFSPLDLICDIIDAIANALGFIVEKGIEFYDWITNLESTQRIISDVAEVWERLKTAIGDSRDNLSEFFEKIQSLPGVQKLMDTINDLIALMSEGLDGALGLIADAFDKVLGTDFGEGFFGVINDSSDKLSTFISVFTEAAGVATDGLSGVYDFVKKISDNIKWPNIWAFMYMLLKFRILFKIGSLIERLGKLGGTIKGLSTIVTKFTKVPEGVNKVLKDASDTLVTMGKKLKSDTLVQIAYAIEKIAISMFLLGMLDPNQMAVAIAGILVVVQLVKYLYKAIWDVDKKLSASQTVVTKFKQAFSIWLSDMGSAFELFMRGGRLALITLSILAFSAALVILIRAFTYLKDLDLASNAEAISNVVAALGVLAGIMAGLIVSSILLSKYASSFGISTALAIVLLASAISIVAKAMGNLSQIKGVSSIVSSLVGLAAAVIALTTGAVLLSKYAKNFTPALAASVLLFSFAMSVLAGAMASLANVKLTSLGAGVVSLLAVLYGFVKIAQLSKKAPLLRFASSLMILSSAMMLLSIPLRILATIKDPTTLLGSVAALVSLMVAFGVVASMSKHMITAGLGMIAMSVAIGVLSLALRSLSGLKWKDTWEGLTIVAAVLAALVIFAGPLKVFAGAALTISFAMITMGVGIYVLITAVAKFISIADELVNNAPTIALAFLLLIAGIAAAIVAGQGLMTLAGMTLVQSFLTAILASSPALLTTIINFVSLALLFTAAAMSGLLDKFVALVVSAIQALADAIVENADPIFDAIQQLLDAIVVFIGKGLIHLVDGAFGDVIPGVRKFCEQANAELDATYDARKANRRGTDVTEGTAEGIKNGTGSVVNAIDGMYSEAGAAADQGNALLATKQAEGGLQATNAFAGNFDPTSIILGQNGTMLGATNELIPQFKETNALLGQEGSGGFSENFDLTSILNEEIGGEGGIEASMLGAIPELGTLGTQLGESGSAGFDAGFDLSTLVGDELSTNVPDSILGATEGTNEAMLGWADSSTDGLPEFFGTEGTEIGDSFGQGISDGLSASGSEESIFAYNDEIFTDANSDAYSYGQEFVGNYTDGELSSVGTAEQAGVDLANATVNGTSLGYSDMQRSGEKSGSGYAKGVDNQKGTAKVAGMSLKNAAASGAEGGYDKMYTAGRYAGEGFYDGMSSWAGRIATKAYNIVSDAVNAAKSAEDAASPSKATRKLGVWFDQGFILGLESLASQVSNTAYNVAGGGVNAMQEAVSRISGIMASDMDYEPTIRPVMDLSNVYDGMDYISDTFDETSSVLGSMNVDVNNSNDLRVLIANTNRIIRSLEGRKPITIDGRTVIGWIDTELGAL